MVICAVVGCNSNSKTSKKEDITFFRLPVDSNIRQIWLNKINRTKLPSEDNIRVCHLHFTEDCLERDLKVGLVF